MGIARFFDALHRRLGVILVIIANVFGHFNKIDGLRCIKSFEHPLRQL